mgnify:CR=1 FL=1
MALLKKRDRIVVFRLTQDEYKLLQKACTRTGARTISDFTRSQLLEQAATRPREDRLEARLAKFDQRLAEVQSAVRHISRLLKQLGEG